MHQEVSKIQRADLVLWREKRKTHYWTVMNKFMMGALYVWIWLTTVHLMFKIWEAL